jgi:predicted ribosome quality control (RQC) complex YloA/Tae2 family protein
MDGTTIYTILHEMIPHLPMKVQKVYQPYKTQLAFSLWSKTKRCKLLISLDKNCLFFGFVSEIPECPKTPSGLCLGLRKRLEGGVLHEIKQEGMDRVLYLGIRNKDSTSQEREYVLVVDMAGKGANIGLYQDNSLTLHIFPADGDRFVHGGPYTPPSQNKVNISLNYDRACLRRKLLSGSARVPSLISSCIAGIGKDLAITLVKSSGMKINEEVGESNVDNVLEAIDQLGSRLKGNKYEPSLYRRRDMRPVFHVIPLVHIDCEARFTSVIETAEVYLREMQLWLESQHLQSTIKATYGRIRKKLESKFAGQTQDFQKASDYQQYKFWAELIYSSGKRQPAGYSCIEVINYYLDPPQPVKIPLNPKLSSAQNARAYYSKYSKMARAHKYLVNSLKTLSQQMEMLETIASKIKTDLEPQELSNLLSSLTALERKAGLTPVKKSGRSTRKTIGRQANIEQPVPKSVIVIQDDLGFKYYVGLGAKDNDYLVRRVKRPGDLWFHAKNAKGAHVLLRAPSGVKITEKEILKGAAIAATHSEARHASKVEVDWVEAKQVRKPKGSPDGFVTYTGQKTVIVSLPE